MLAHECRKLMRLKKLNKEKINNQKINESKINKQKLNESNDMLPNIIFDNELQEKIYKFIQKNDNCIGVNEYDIYSSIKASNDEIKKELKRLENESLIRNGEYMDSTIYCIHKYSNI